MFADGETPRHYPRPRTPFLIYDRPPRTPYITMLALPPQSGACPHAKPSMSPRTSPHCIACYYKQTHVCSDSDRTLYSPDNISLTGLKLEDASPAVREIPETWAQLEPQYKLRPFLQPDHHVDTAASTPRSCAVPDPDPAGGCGVPGHQFRSSFPEPEMLLRSDAPRIRKLGAFPREWSRGWDPHPTIPGLWWTHRRWTDGKCPAKLSLTRRFAEDIELTPPQEE